MQKIKKILLGMILLSLLIFPLLKTYASVNSESQRLYLNTMYTKTIEKGQVLEFYYTPDTNQYLVLETYGNTDTLAEVYSPSIEPIISDDDGTISNAKICFQGKIGEKISIRVKCYSSTSQGDTIVQLRKQRFTMFTGDDERESHLTTPTNSFYELYEVTRYVNISQNAIMLNDSRDLPRLNSEILYFSGNAYSVNGKWLGVELNEGALFNTDNLNLYNTKLALWAASYTASSANENNLSIAQHSVNELALSSLGFEGSISSSSSKTFTDAFFKELSKGSTVSDSASKGAQALLWPWDSAKDYKIFGDGNVSMTSQSQSSASFVIKGEQDYSYIEESLQKGYLKTYLGENVYRYFEQINGRISNNIIDVTYDDDLNIISVNDLRSNYQQILPTKLLYSNDMDMNLKFSFSLDSISRNIVYYNIGGVMTPILVVTKDNCTVSEVTCTNLYTGKLIDYDLINKAF